MNDWETDTRKFYGEKGLGSRVGWGSHPALVVVDLAKGFTDPESPLGGDLDAQVGATAELLDACRRYGHPVIYMTVAYKPDFSDGATFVEKVPALKVLVQGSHWVEIDERITPRADEPVVVKQFASAFFGTDVAQRLRSQGVDTVLLAGCSTSGCIRASAIDSMQYGFHTIVVEQAVGDRAEGPHQANLFDIDSKYGDVIDLEEAIGKLKELAALAA
jgi:maleamate amidohydrolase